MRTGGLSGVYIRRPRFRCRLSILSRRSAGGRVIKQHGVVVAAIVRDPDADYKNSEVSNPKHSPLLPPLSLSLSLFLSLCIGRHSSCVSRLQAIIQNE